MATNLDVGMEITTSARVVKEGSVAVPALTLGSFLEHTTGDDANLSVTGDTLQVAVGNASATINTVSHEDFPTLPRVQGEQMHVPAGRLVEGLRSVWYAASLSSMKPELSSVFVTHSNDGIIFVATDSFRLAEKSVSVDGVSNIPAMLIPFKNVGEIIRNVEKLDVGEDVLINTDDNQASFLFGEVYITSRLVDGTFPDYKQIVPSEQTTEAVVLKQDLIQALKVTGVFANRFNQATLNFDPKQKKFSIQTSGGEAGESAVTVDAALSGEKERVSFNQKYITDSFQSISGDSVVLRLFGGTKPMVIKSTSDPSFMYLTMPMSR